MTKLNPPIHAFLVLLLASSAPRLLAQEVSQEVVAGKDSRQDLLREKRREKAKHLSPYEVSPGEARVHWVEETHLPEKILVRGWHGIRPVIGGGEQGAGRLVGGIGYVQGLDSEVLQLTVNARTSTNSYQVLDAQIDFPTALSDSPLRVSLDASFRNLKRFSFYGIGNDSDRLRTFYRIKDSWAGGVLNYQANRFVELGLDARWLSARTDAGFKEPSLETVFPPESVPGFDVPRSDYTVYGARANIDLRDHGFPRSGVKVLLEARRFDDRDDRFDFTRLAGETIAYLPLGYRNRILAARFATSHSMPDRGQEVPFYLMEPVGGSRTLRGFDADRFRDVRNLMINLEYRWEVWTFADFALLYDWGKVFASADDFDLSGLKQGYGFAVRAHSPVGGVMRWDITHSKEGWRMYLWLGNATFFNE
jgi:hypothetical protein